MKSPSAFYDSALVRGILGALVSSGYGVGAATLFSFQRFWAPFFWRTESGGLPFFAESTLILFDSDEVFFCQ